MLFIFRQMSTPTHVLTINGRRSFELSDHIRPVIDQIARTLDRLDGAERYALMLWQLPPGMRLPDVDTSHYPVEYLQSAGSAARQSIEIRRKTSTGYEQAVVGKRDFPSVNPLIEQIIWDRYTLEVRENEVFSSSEAIEVYRRYLEGAAIDKDFTLRPLTLD